MKEGYDTVSLPFVVVPSPPLAPLASPPLPSLAVGPASWGGRGGLRARGRGWLAGSGQVGAAEAARGQAEAVSKEESGGGRESGRRALGSTGKPPVEPRLRPASFFSAREARRT